MEVAIVFCWHLIFFFIDVCKSFGKSRAKCTGLFSHGFYWRNPHAASSLFILMLVTLSWQIVVLKPPSYHTCMTCAVCTIHYLHISIAVHCPGTSLVCRAGMSKLRPKHRFFFCSPTVRPHGARMVQAQKLCCNVHPGSQSDGRDKS